MPLNVYTGMRKKTENSYSRNLKFYKKPPKISLDKILIIGRPKI